MSFDIIDFYHRELQLLGVDSLKRDLTAASETLRALTPGFDSGALLPPLIGAALPLEQAADAYRMVEKGASGRSRAEGVVGHPGADRHG
ncbi:MAG: hypothetical protein WDO73_06625 [Ignavibacteriota bacterium]